MQANGQHQLCMKEDFLDFTHRTSLDHLGVQIFILRSDCYLKNNLDECSREVVDENNLAKSRL